MASTDRKKKKGVLYLLLHVPLHLQLLEFLVILVVMGVQRRAVR
jgi:hypothetical protein